MRVFLAFTDAFVERAALVALTRLADVRVVDRLEGVSVVVGLALLAVLALRVVHAVIANTSGDEP